MKRAAKPPAEPTRTVAAANGDRGGASRAAATPASTQQQRSEAIQGSARVTTQRQRIQAAFGTAAPPVVQRYVDVRFHVGNTEKHWRQSDPGNLLVESTGEPGYRSKEMYASPGAIALAQNQLRQTGSFIRLSAGEAFRGRVKVVPEFVGPGARQGTVYGHAASVTQGDALTLPSDCNNAARIVMGIEHAPTNVDSPPTDENVELPVGSQGAGERTFERSDFELNKAGGYAATAVERTGMSHLTGSMVGFRTELQRPERHELATSAGGEFFMRRTRLLATEEDEAADLRNPAGWAVLHELQQTHPQFYAEFAKWSGVDAAARPKVGDALVTYVPGGKLTDVITRNPRAYQALVDTLKGSISNPITRGSMTESLRRVVATARQESLQFLEDAKTLTSELEKSQLKLKELQESPVPEAEVDQKMRTSAINKLASDIKFVLPERVTRAKSESVKANANAELVVPVIERLSQPETEPAQLAAAVLQLLGINADTTFTTLKDVVNKKGDQLGKDAMEGMVGAIEGATLWNKHWGGVVMNDGADYVTLENDASTAPEGANLNTRWGFAMYGSKKAGQSFHEQMLRTGDFGSFASTARTRGRGAHREEATPEQDTQLWSAVDTMLAYSDLNQEKLESVVSQLSPPQRGALRKRCQERLAALEVTLDPQRKKDFKKRKGLGMVSYDTPDYQILKAVIALLA